MDSNVKAGPRAGGQTDYLYRRIEAAVRATIADGKLTPGTLLPSESELAEQFGTTRVTVAKALAALERDGLIHRLVGRGTFVAESKPVTSEINTRQILSFEEQMGLAGRTVTFRLLGFTRVSAPAFARERLRLPAGTRLYRLDRLRLIDGRVICLEERYIPSELAERISAPMLAAKGAVEIVSELLGYHLPWMEVMLYPAVADRKLARLLEVRSGSPVTVREHVLRDRSRRAVVCGVNTFTAAARISYTLGTGHAAGPDRRGQHHPGQ